MIFIALAGSLLLTSSIQAQHKITVTIDGYEKDTCILGYVFGTQTLIEKQVFERNENGDFVFEGDEALLGGLYRVLIKPGNMFFQFILSGEEEQKDLKIYTKIGASPSRDLTQNLKIKNSLDNDVMEDFRGYVSNMIKKRENYNKKLEEAKKKEDKAAEEKVLEQLKGLDKEVMKHQDDLLAKYPKLLAPKLIRGNRQIQVPEHLKTQLEIYHYYKEHFWDDFDWSDPRLIRTPLLLEKLNVYIDRLTPAHVDSVTKSCLFMIEQARINKSKDMYRFMATHLLNKYAKQKIICMDGVYVSIAQKYYCSGLVDWADSTQLAKICEDAKNMAHLRCGNPAPEIRLKNIIDSNYVTLSSVRKPFTVVYFWDPTCGNCSKMSKKLVPVYNKYKERGLEILGVCSNPWKSVDVCQKKVKEQKMDWINTSDDPYPLAVVKKYYDLRSNPFIYLLDENKRILWKRISAEQLDEILEREFKIYEERKAKK